MSKANTWPSGARSSSLSRSGNRSWSRARFSARWNGPPRSWRRSSARSSAAWRCGGCILIQARPRGARRSRPRIDPGKLARLVYTYIHLFIVGGIIVAAVADEFVLHHPTGHSDFKTVVAALGATALYLVGNLLFKWTIAGKLPVSHMVGLIAVAMLAPVASHFAPWLLSLTTSMLLIVVAVWERWSLREG